MPNYLVDPPPYPLDANARPPWYRQILWNSVWSKRNGVHYIGDDVVLDLTRVFTGLNYDTFRRYTTFESGTHGNTIATATQASDGSNAGCFEETYWDEQWIFDVELPSAVTCTAVRINVAEASYGGEPFPVVFVGADKRGEGHETQGYRIEEIAVVDSNRYAGFV